MREGRNERVRGYAIGERLAAIPLNEAEEKKEP